MGYHEDYTYAFGDSEVFDTEFLLIVAPAIGKKIKKIHFDDIENQIVFIMETGYCFVIKSKSPDCCESRYIHTDDDLSSAVGETLLDFELSTHQDIETDDGEHQIGFFKIHTDKDTYEFASHNEHNGYYSGVHLRAIR